MTDKMNPRVTELFAVIKAAEAELERIRAACPHKTFTVGDWMDSPGAIYKARICDECGDYLGLVMQDGVSNTMNTNQIIFYKSGDVS
jgi:hypothetical protein